MNSLSVPQWGKKKREEKLPLAKNYLGIQSEAVRDDKEAGFFITVEVRGLKAVPAGAYKLAYIEGQQLGRYLSRLKLKKVAIYAAVYDAVHGGNRRLRMTYVPREGSHITIGMSQAGPATAMQRSNVDAERVALNMGGKGGTAKVVERKNPWSSSSTATTTSERTPSRIPIKVKSTRIRSSATSRATTQTCLVSLTTINWQIDSPSTKR